MKPTTMNMLCALLLIGIIFVPHASQAGTILADRDGNDAPETATGITVPHEGDYEIEPAGDID